MAMKINSIFSLIFFLLVTIQVFADSKNVIYGISYNFVKEKYPKAKENLVSLVKKDQFGARYADYVDWRVLTYSQLGKQFVSLVSLGSPGYTLIANHKLLLLYGDLDGKKISLQKNFNHEYYGSMTRFSKLELVNTKNGKVIVALQIRYGFSSDSINNELYLFNYGDSKFKVLLKKNIDSVEFLKNGQYSSSIRGLHIETLCKVCDGWEVSAQEDIFKIPISINLNLMTSGVYLSKIEKQALIQRLDKRIKKRSDEKSSAKYDKFLKQVRKRIIKLLRF